MSESYRSRFWIEWLLLICALGVLGLFIATSLYTEHAAIDQRERDRLAVQAKVIEKTVSRSLEVINRALLGIRDDLPGWQLEKDGMIRASMRLSAFSAAMRSVRTFMVIDAEGNVLASNRSELLGQNFSKREYFQAVLRRPEVGTFYVGPPFKTVLGVWTFNVVRMIQGSNGEFAGIVSATIDPEELRSETGAVLYEEDMISALAHGDGLQILMEPDRPDEAGKNLAQPDSFFFRHMSSGKMAQVLEGTVAATGELRLMALQTIRPATVPMDKPLVAAVSRDMQALYASWQRRAWLEGGLFAMFAGLSLPGLAFSQRRRQRLQVQSVRAAAALAESARFMRSLIDVIPGMVGYWDTDLCCRFANIAYQEWFGKAPDEMRGIHIQDLMGDDLFQQNESHIRTVLSGEPVDFERSLVKADGSPGFTWAHYIPDVVNGKVLGFFVLVSDITAIKVIQQQLEASNTALEKRSIEAEAASRAKSTFVANMSHEIRTPMNAVVGLLQLLQLTHLDPRQLDYVEKARGAAQSLLGILNDILDFSKVEAGKLTLDDTPFRLDELLRNLSVVLSSALQRKEVEVLFQLDPGIPRALRGDGMRLQQVLLNLAGNAIKFTERGEVVIALSLLADESDEVHIEFSVRDTGIGIPAEILPRLFSAFEQADVSTTRRFGGTGLGLAISRRLVRLMGGELMVNSELGKGSDFHFAIRFRRDVDTRTLECVAAQEFELQHPLRVLIVDDNVTSREVLADIAASFRWQAETASSGVEALARLHEAEALGRAFDVLCVDWIMPNMDGWETIQHLRASHAGRLPAILMITAHGRELIEERLNIEPNAIDDFLVKPVTPSMLFNAVARATGSASVTATRRAGERSLAGDRPLAGLRILLVEDHPLNQQVASELLAHAGADVQVAGNGRLAIESVKCAVTPFDAILMDIQMPEMDGYVATRILREDMGVRTPIIAMTANALPSDRAACLAAGMNEHIGKPIDIRELIESLLRHCRGKSVEDYFHSPRVLPDLPEDFDLAGALARIDGNTSLFATFAQRFGSDGLTLAAAAGAALRLGDRAAAGREMHTLKGLAASLGAQRLSQKAAEAETTFNATASDDDQLRLNDVDKELAAATTVLLTIADQLTPATLSSDRAQLDLEIVLERLDELEALLAQQNMRALDVFATLKQNADSSLCKHLEHLDAALLKLDFVAAREKIANLKMILKK